MLSYSQVSQEFSPQSFAKYRDASTNLMGKKLYHTINGQPGCFPPHWALPKCPTSQYLQAASAIKTWFALWQNYHNLEQWQTIGHKKLLSKASPSVNHEI